MTVASGIAASHDRTDDGLEQDGKEPDLQVNTRAVEEASPNVTPQLIGAKQVVSRGRQQPLIRVQGDRIVTCE